MRQLRNVYLYGALRRKFGRVFRLGVRSPAEAVRALAMQLKGFGEEIRAGRFKVIAGHPHTGRSYPNDIEMLHFGMGQGQDLHIVPVIQGSGGSKGGFGAFIVIGLTLIAAALIAGPQGFALAATAIGFTETAAAVGTFAFNATLALGASLALQGVAGMLAKTPKTLGGDTNDEASRRQSFLFGSTGQGTTQGTPVPVAYGRIRVSGVPISLGLTVREGG